MAGGSDMKKIITLMISLLLCVSLFGINTFAETTVLCTGVAGDSVNYTLYSNGTLEFVGTGPISDVTSANRFSNQIENQIHRTNVINKIIVGEGITAIGDYAFYSLGYNFTEIKLPSTLKSIGKQSLANNSGLKQIVLPEGLETIKDQAFYYSGLTSVAIPSTVKTLYQGVFNNMSYLRTVYIPSTVETIIPSEVGYGQVNTIFFGDNVNIFTDAQSKNSGWRDGWNYTSQSSELRTYYSSNINEYNYWANLDRNATTVVIPNYIKRITKNAFYGMKNLQNVYIGTNVTECDVIWGNDNVFDSNYDVTVYFESNQTEISNIFKNQWHYNTNKGCYAILKFNQTMPDIDTAYTITYNLNGGTNSPDNPDSYKYLDTVTFVNPTKENWTFGGWYSDENFTTPVTKISQGSSGNLTLYAKFTKDTYAASVSIDETVVVDEDVKFTITTDKAFASSELTVTYDKEKLSYKGISGNANVKDSNGTLTIASYGENNATGYTLTFTATNSGNAKVALSSAKFSTKEKAEIEDLEAATIVSDGEASVKIRSKIHSVTLDSTLFTGTSTVDDSQTYYFTPSDSTHYDYTLPTATVGGINATVKVDSTNNRYYVENVQDDLVITGTRTGKTYTITYNTTTSATLPTTPVSAKYGDTVNVTIPSEENWAYSVTSVSGQLGDYSVDNGMLSFTMGANVTVTIDKETRDQSVTVEGNGVSDVTASQSYTQGNDFSFTVTKDSAYTYTVSAKVNNTSVDLAHEDESDEYTITAPAYGGIVITVNKTVVNGTVTASQYVQLNGSKIFLIKNTIEKLDGRYFTYDGKDMVWSEKYGAYCLLVKANTAPTIDESKFALKYGTVSVISYDGDVNMTNHVDSNDAQLIWNIYNTEYDGFTTNVTIEKYLRADVNGDGVINVSDAAQVLKIAYGISNN